MNKYAKRYHTQYGRDSGIPECCIEFFVTEWSYITHKFPLIFKHYWEQQEKVSAELNRFIGYIPCPDCLKNHKIVDVIKCPSKLPPPKPMPQSFTVRVGSGNIEIIKKIRN